MKKEKKNMEGLSDTQLILEWCFVKLAILLCYPINYHLIKALYYQMHTLNLWFSYTFNRK